MTCVTDLGAGKDVLEEADLNGEEPSARSLRKATTEMTLSNATWKGFAQPVASVLRNNIDS